MPGSISTIRQQVQNLYPGATVFTPPLQTFTLNVTSVADQAEIPEAFQLQQNHPNPFNPTTAIEFSLSRAATVTLKVYNILGKKIRTLNNGPQPPGTHKTTWTAKMKTAGPLRQEFTFTNSM